MRIACAMIAAVLALTAAPASTEEVNADWYNRFQLWNGCMPVDVLVVRLSEDKGKIGLREEHIETMVRSRLRGARIYDGIPRRDDPGWLAWSVRRMSYGEPYLYVDIRVGSLTFYVEVGFRRYVWLTVPEGMDPLDGPATTWRTDSAGTHGGDESYILSWLSRHVDEFIDEYLRVNADIC